MFVESLLSFTLFLSVQTTQVEIEDTYVNNVLSIQELKLNEYSPEEFKNLWESSHLLNTLELNEAPIITGNDEADMHIRKLAEERGYELQPISKNSETQNIALRAFNKMEEAARKEGIGLGITSAFRSVDQQRSIFLFRLSNAIGRGYSYSDIAEGVYDSQIDNVLSQSSIPGYSKHHSGYALDLRDDTSGVPFTQFKNTRAFEWISSNNYQNAKKFGFIPSYPEGASKLGPDPEAWEYTWIGITNLSDD